MLVSRVCKSILGELSHVVQKYMTPNCEDYCDFSIINEDTKGLAIMLHGMSDYPKQFYYHIDEFKKIPNIALFVPKILDKGLNTLENCGTDIYNKINLTNVIKYNIPIYLIGISNGGRICLYLFTKIIEQYKNIYVTTLGSPLNGTYMANIALSTRLYVCTKYYNKGHVLEELTMNSDTAKELIKSCSKHDIFKTNTKFYSANQDVVVFPYTCSTIDGFNNSFIDECGHDGLIVKCYKDQINWLLSKTINC